MHLRTVRFAIFGLLLGAIPVACGKTHGDNAAITIHAVTGKVKLADGQPVRGASVRLMAKGTEGGADGIGVLASDGTFTIKSMGDREGMMPGVYKVVINPSVPAPGVSPADQTWGKQHIPKKFWAEDTTDLEVTVKSEDNKFEWTLK